MTGSRHAALALLVGILASAPACTCSGPGRGGAGADGGEATDAAATNAASAPAEGGASPGGAEAGGLSAPIAAARGEKGEVFVAALDVGAKAIQVQRIGSDDAVSQQRKVLDGVAWSTDSDLRVSVGGGSVVVVWRGLRGGKLVRQFVVLGTDLAPRAEPTDVAAASCVTRDALWSTDGTHVRHWPWAGKPSHGSFPKDHDAVLVCGATQGFALLDEDRGTSVVALTPSPSAALDASARVPDASARAGLVLGAPVPLLTEADFGEDEQRERADFTVGDELGVVRLGASGAIAMRTLVAGAPGPLRKLRTLIPRDDDVVAVDASAKAVVVVFTEDVGEACASDGAVVASVKVRALRIDRATLEESTLELSPGACGREVGPFFSGAVGESVSIGWVERVPVTGKARAPVGALRHLRVPASGAVVAQAARIEQNADALVDAGCDAERCYAVALARRPGADVMVPGFARVLRY